LTHSHVDHIGALKPYVETTGADVYIHSDEWEYLDNRKEELDRSAEELGFEDGFYDVNPGFVEDGDRVELGDHDFEVLHTPGHTPGSICLYNADERVLFSGDTVLGDGSPGRTDMNGGDSDALKKSIDRLSKLDVETIYPGHFEEITQNVDRRIMLARSLV
ncbi:MAG: MBL fold metallo-hydrolase, partial [Halobacteria archaeon]|nr:MBL fold metallo-hydrolase [Halobacteria archaeon]